MYRLLPFLSAFFLFSGASADTNQETFQNCADGFNSQDCNHINEADQRFRGIESSLAGIEGLLGNIAKGGPGWKFYEYFPDTDSLVESDDVIVVQYPYNRINSINSALLMIKLTEGAPYGMDWYPAVYAPANGQVTLGWQGLEAVSTVLAWHPNTGCTGEPIAMVSKLHPALGLRAFAPSNNKFIEFVYSRPYRWWVGYDYRNGKAYRFQSGGSTSADKRFDLLEYGFDDGWLPNEFGCKENVLLSERPDLTIDGQVIILNEPSEFAVNPYANFNYDRELGILFR